MKGYKEREENTLRWWGEAPERPCDVSRDIGTSLVFRVLAGPAWRAVGLAVVRLGTFIGLTTARLVAPLQP